MGTGAKRHSAVKGVYTPALQADAPSDHQYLFLTVQMPQPEILKKETIHGTESTQL